MKLHEYEAKQVFREFGIPVPAGGVASTPDEARRIAESLGKPVVVKAQVLVAGRGKAGAIRAADTPEEAYREAERLLGSEVKGLRVEKVLVEEKADIRREMYLSLTLDRSARRMCFLASSEGGVDIEELAARSPEKIARLHVSPYFGVRDFEARKLARHMQLTGEEARQLAKVVKAFYAVAERYDCELVESNPLALCGSGLVAVDARMIVDDNSLYRHPELAERMRKERRGLTEYEVKAMEHGFSYVELDGEIGVIANGAGLTMASMDLVALKGGKPANFLDIGGGATAERVKEAVKIQLKHPRVRGVLVNILGGITRCDEVARGLVEAIRETGVAKPMAVRMVGTREEEGRRILDEAGISWLETMEEAADKIVKLVYGGE